MFDNQQKKTKQLQQFNQQLLVALKEVQDKNQQLLQKVKFQSQQLFKLLRNVWLPKKSRMFMKDCMKEENHLLLPVANRFLKRRRKIVQSNKN
ncbi:unnamed protein product [Paramecium octaurelia]|uniref:Uncharacterized protein n=1 Tax=Paramecium octaurelia TaxID=43137 RepID=A0A8S1XLE1_PAROT|nr:unnamed protein product [Paramecium octaurelia]